MGTAALIIGILALVVAVMSAIYHILAKPKVAVHYSSTRGYKLWIRIQNAPIDNKILSVLGFKRRSANIRNIWIAIKGKNMECDLANMCYGEAVNKNIRELTSGNAKIGGVTLEASPYSAVIDVVGITSIHDGRVFVIDENGKYDQILSTGLFTVHIEFLVDGRGQKEAKDFQVNPSDPFVQWVN
jgi:hypothetical protein